MQEEVENRAITLAIRTTKLTGEVLKTAISKYLAYRNGKSEAKVSVKPTGKQTVKELIGQNQGVSNIEITEGNIRSFERYARKYGVDFAVKKDRSGEIPKYLVFFKSRDADALMSALMEYTNKLMPGKEKPSILKILRDAKQRAHAKEISKVRNKDKGLEL